MKTLASNWRQLKWDDDILDTWVFNSSIKIKLNSGLIKM